MSVFLYIMGMIPSLIVAYKTEDADKLRPWARVSIVLLWPAAMFLVAVIFLWQLWVLRDGA